MASAPKDEENQQTTSDSQAIGLLGSTKAKYRELREHAETYPYVWASYIVVYGGLGLWFTYRWRKLRKTEDRVRSLQQRLRELARAEESASSGSTAVSSDKMPSEPSHIEKPDK